jgi:hypothetical protein
MKTESVTMQKMTQVPADSILRMAICEEQFYKEESDDVSSFVDQQE